MLPHIKEWFFTGKKREKQVEKARMVVSRRKERKISRETERREGKRTCASLKENWKRRKREVQERTCIKVIPDTLSLLLCFYPFFPFLTAFFTLSLSLSFFLTFFYCHRPSCITNRTCIQFEHKKGMILKHHHQVFLSLPSILSFLLLVVSLFWKQKGEKKRSTKISGSLSLHGKRVCSERKGGEKRKERKR